MKILNLNIQRNIINANFVNQEQIYKKFYKNE